MSSKRRRFTMEFFQFVAAYDADYVTRDGQLVIDDPEADDRLIEAVDATGRLIAKAVPRPTRSHGTTATTTSSFSRRRSS